MKLRSDFSSLKSLCSSYELDQDTLIKRLSDAGYHFDEQQNQFRNNVNNNES